MVSELIRAEMEEKEMTRKFAGLTLGFFLLTMQPALMGCMTTQKESRKYERTAKKSKKSRSGDYGLVNSRNELDRAHLRRGQKAMYSNALDSY